jgi:hypothetical protein
MKLETIDNIQKKELAIQYRREYNGEAVFTSPINGSCTTGINFTLEHSPVGDPIVNVSLLDDIDYPLLPILGQLKVYIKNLDREGKLL